jgi:hypothetical protein
MSSAKARFYSRLPWAVFLVIVLMALWDVVFMRYVLYHSQNRNLRPSDYDIQVVTAEDYRSLSDPGETTVHLSDGSVLTEAVAWDPTAFKPVQDGTLFTKVTTKGTAHILAQVLPKTTLTLIFGILGMVVTWPRACKADHGSRIG